jgi:site-specific DNA-methyltransferase (adenine-specific)
MFMLNTLYNADCLPAMREIPDKFFELAIVDPPYGDAGGVVDYQGRHDTRFGGRFDKYVTRTGGSWASKYGKEIDCWDVAPPPEYFTELFRVSVNQIIWGGNYFQMPPTRSFIVWDKLNISEGFTMAMCEYAWTSFNGNAKLIKCIPQGTANEPRFHPTQKPVKLYERVINLFAAPGDKILDTHSGSGSCLVAAHRAGHEWLGFEVSPEYCAKAAARIETERAQVRLREIGADGGG